jgi:SAM-dependent methyltransferase
MARVQFALKMLLAYARSDRNRCPYCQSCLHLRLQRKWLILQARKCVHCGLIFRYPTDSSQDAVAFYEHHYRERLTKDLPKAEELEALVSREFAGSPYDKSERVRFLQNLCPLGRCFDVGCSWGYGAFQMGRRGYHVTGFELSRPMAAYGRSMLGLDIRGDWAEIPDALAGSFDFAYADHSLEHTHDLRATLEHLARLIKPAGLLVVFVPNAGGLGARMRGVRWAPFVGEAHTIAFTDRWFRDNLPTHGFTIEKLTSCPEGEETLMDGDELICIARRR